MAIQQLTQPILNPIVAFDATKSNTISFIVIGGAQVIGNRLVISDNKTGQEVYNKVQSTMKLEHLIPANTLKNGGYYNAVIYTIDNGGNESSASIAIPFYCYSQPILTIDNIPITETIENGTYKFTGNYLQLEKEILNSYQYTLYDSNKEILSQSPLIYYETDNSLSYTFVGMSNDTSYYVELTGQTINGTKISSGLRYFTVRYLQPASFAICDLVNNCEDGYIQISSNIVAIDGNSNPKPPIYIDDKEVDLRDPNAWVEWSEGFRIQNNFTMRAWGRDFNPYEKIITLTNNLNSEEKPNKIELKWMLGDTIKKLPEITTVYGKNVNLVDSENDKITNLSIRGSSIQNSEQGKDFGTEKSLSIDTIKQTPLQVNILGNVEQKTVKGIQLLEGTNEGTTGWLFATNPSNKGIIKEVDYLGTKAAEFSVSEEINSWKYIKRQFKDYSKLKKNTKYTILLDVKTNYDESAFSISLKNNIGTNVFLEFPIASINNTSRRLKLVGTSNDLELTDQFLYISAGHIGVPGRKLIITNLIMVEGDYSNKDLEWEEYTNLEGMPSINYPSEIRAVGDNINLLENIAKTQIINGVEFTVNPDKTIKINGTATSNTSLDITGNFAITEQSIFSGMCDGYGYNKMLIQIQGADYNVNIPNSNPQILQPKDNVKVRIYIYAGTSINNAIIKPKIEKGTVATSYSEFEQGSVEIKKTSANYYNVKSYVGSQPPPADENDWITLTGNNTGTSAKYLNYFTENLNLNIGKNYWIVAEIKNVSGKGTFHVTSRDVGREDGQFFGNPIQIAEIKKGDKVIFQKTAMASANFGLRTFVSLSQGESCNITFRLSVLKDEPNVQLWKYIPYDKETFLLPVQKPMLTGDYFDRSSDKEIHTWKKVVLDGVNNKVFQGNTSVSGKYRYQFNDADLKDCSLTPPDNIAYCESLPLLESGQTYDCNYGFTVKYGGIYIYTDGKPVADFNTQLQTNNMVFYIPVIENAYEKLNFTTEQKQVLDELNLTLSYPPTTNFSTTENLALLDIKKYSIPNINNPLKIYSVGDRKNIINISDFNISYNQEYNKTTYTDFKLRSGYIYTLSFDFEINDASTDLYFDIGYGKNNSWEGEIIESTQYINSNKGRNKITFLVPDKIGNKEFPQDTYLYIKFVKTIILANVDIDISNIQLESGGIATDYQVPNMYNIYPTVSGKNLYDYKKPVYILRNNVTYQGISNGYDLQVVNVATSQDTYFSIGYRNILNAGEKYAISYQYEGNLKGFKLYVTEKEGQERIQEIKINNGVFTMPEGLYDLQLVFFVDATNASNSLEIWNIQIEKNNEITDYEPYKENTSIITLDKPLMAIGSESYADLISLKSLNILNPDSQSANVVGNKTYSFMQNGNNTYYIWYYNSQGNLIKYLDEEGHEKSGEIIKGSGIFTTHKDCAKIIVTKTNDPDLKDLTKSEILNNHISISKGQVSQYYPYVDRPVLIDYTQERILNGTEKWIATSAPNQNQTMYFSIPNNQAGLTSDKINCLSDGLSSYTTAKLWNIDVEGICQSEEFISLRIFKSRGVNSVTTLKTFLSKNNIKGIFRLSEPTVKQLTEENANALKSLISYSPTSNVFTNNEILGNIEFDYVNNYSEQQAQNAYVQLKCYNSNKMPYFIHSNYIDIPEDKNKIFIWLRRKNNLFDLKIEDLGVYNEEDNPTDKTNPIVTLDINNDDITQSQIPVTAHAIDEIGLKTMRFSKDNGVSWDEVVPVDGLASTNNYVFDNLKADTYYTIRVEAIDLSGNIGGISKRVTTKA